MLPEVGALPKNMRSRQDAMGLSEFREDARGFQAPTLASFRPRRCQRHLAGAGPRELQRIPRTAPAHSHFQPPTPVQLTCPARFRAPHASAAIFRSASSPSFRHQLASALRLCRELMERGVQASSPRPICYARPTRSSETLWQRRVPRFIVAPPALPLAESASLVISSLLAIIPARFPARLSAGLSRCISPCENRRSLCGAGSMIACVRNSNPAVDSKLER
ncbi:hypothetical protein PaG_04169 [Moesziomyces aphidis]|uniref:Uncharacterized protein n=1 Tax=Moesziomyces aphidis TaxID=84754 RepID=W3VLP8_MOEAP|nr:hypothetical protein PaG_04169 [Moesziomyces aphidis]